MDICPFSRYCVVICLHSNRMAERVKALALLLQAGLMPVQIVVATMKVKHVLNIGKPPAPNSVL